MVSKGMVSIGHDVWLGVGAQVLSGVNVGHGAVIAAGAVVLSNTKVEAGSIYAGNPAKKIKDIMENAVDLEVPNKVDYESGPNWGEIK